MTPSIRPILAALALLVAAAQAAAPQNLPSAPASKGSAPAPPVAAADALGRQTPAGAVMGFLASAGRGDWQRAARYLDTRLPEGRAEELARELKVLLDRGLTVDLDRLSHSPDGSQDLRFGRDHELVGTIDAQSGKLDVLLVRVRDADGSQVWLFSPETLREVPSAHEEYEPSLIEQYLPQSFTRGYGLRYMWWSWLVMVVGAAVAFLLAWLLTRAIGLLVRRLLRRVSPSRVWPRWQALLGPARWLIFGVTLQLIAPFFLTLRQRYVGDQVAEWFIVASLTWLGVRLLASTVGRWAARLERQGTTERVALVRLAGRLLQAAAVAVGALVFLQSVGINLTPVLAGLGVGGIAVALASQKTLENLFGGMMVIGDSPIRIGHFCRVGTMLGTVEDIGLRSTRIRTIARTEISIPNADLASQSIENFATRDKMLFNHTFSLRYETTPEQLRFVLAGLRSLLYQHEMVESARVRFLRFGQSGLDVEVFAYLATTDYDAFLAIQEDLLLRLMETIDASGTGFAFPSRTVYFTRDPGMDREKSAAAAAAVQAWREAGELPFPDLAGPRKASLRGGIEYPPRESVLRRDDDRS